MCVYSYTPAKLAKLSTNKQLRKKKKTRKAKPYGYPLRSCMKRSETST